MDACLLAILPLSLLRREKGIEAKLSCRYLKRSCGGKSQYDALETEFGIDDETIIIRDINETTTRTFHTLSSSAAAGRGEHPRSKNEPEKQRGAEDEAIAEENGREGKESLYIETAGR